MIAGHDAHDRSRLHAGALPRPHEGIGAGLEFLVGDIAGLVDQGDGVETAFGLCVHGAGEGAVLVGRHDRPDAVVHARKVQQTCAMEYRE